MPGLLQATQAEENRERVLVQKASRGVIYDRNGEQLVTNEPSYSVVVSPAALAGFNCVTRQLLPNTVFINLGTIVGSSKLLAFSPHAMPLETWGGVGKRQARHVWSGKLFGTYNASRNEPAERREDLYSIVAK